jgi:Ran GTPase-activating protein (RanGAP) involved in mRNA processing and transport
MAAVLSSALRRIVGEEKCGLAPYSVLLRRLDQQAKDGVDGVSSVDVILSGKHKDLFNVRVTDECVTLLAAAISSAFPPPGDDDAAANTTTTTNQIGVLDLSCNNLGDAAAQALASEVLLGGVRVRELRLRSNDITSVGAAALCGALTVPGAGACGTTVLDLNGNPLGDGVCDAVCNMVRTNESVRRLDLGNTQIGTMTLIQLAKVMWYNGTVRVLNLENPRAAYDKQETACYHLAKMVRANRALSELYLGKHGISDRGAQLLAEYLEDNATLRVLDLRANRIGVAGAEAFAILLMRGGSVLSTLNLASNRICDQGGQALGVALRSSRHLLSLDISSNEIGDLGLVAVADALNANTTLQRLLLFGNNFGEQSSDAFRELSETRFKFYDLEEKDFRSYVVDGRPCVAKVRNYAAEEKDRRGDVAEL